MKKILTASLVAMMAVTAANADIASTKYVNTQAGIPENQATFSATDFTGAAAGKTNIKDAVNAIAESLVTNLGTGGNVESQINTKIDAFEEDVIGTVAEGKTVTEMISDAQTAAEGKVTALENGQVTTNKNEIAGLKTSKLDVSTYDTDKAAMTLTEKGGAGSFIQQVAQANGTVTATATAFETDINDTSTVAPQTKAIKSYVDTEISALSGSNSTLTSKVASLESWKTEANTSIANNADDIKGLQTADTAMDGRVDDLESDNTTNKSNITSLQNAVNSINNAEAAGSVANKIAGVEADLGDVTAANMGTTADTVVGAIKEVATEAAAAQTAADTAQGEVNALEGVVAQQKTDLQKAISDGDADTLADAKADATTKADAAKNAAISDAAGKYQVKSSKLSIGGAGGTWTDLTTTEVGYNATGTYSLVLKDGDIRWEKVSY